MTTSDAEAVFTLAATLRKTDYIDDDADCRGMLADGHRPTDRQYCSDSRTPHVHVDRDDLSAKFWLQPVGLARNFGFSPKELRRIQRLVIEHQAEFLEAWHGHLGTGG
jgi:hypothetical protein